MDYESRETLAKAYEFLRMTHELVNTLMNSIEAMKLVMAVDDPNFQQKFESSFLAAEMTEQARAHALALGVIDSVLATLRSGQMGNA